MCVAQLGPTVGVVKPGDGMNTWKKGIAAKRKAFKKGKRKVQGVPQSQTAALPRPQAEEETDKSKQAQIEQT